MSARQIRLKRNDFWKNNINPYHSLSNILELQKANNELSDFQNVLEMLGTSTNMSYIRNMVFSLATLYIMTIFLSLLFWLLTYITSDSFLFYLVIAYYLYIIFASFLIPYYSIKSHKVLKHRADLILEQENKKYSNLSFSLSFFFTLTINSLSDNTKIDIKDLAADPAVTLLNDRNIDFPKLKKLIHVPDLNLGQSYSGPFFDDLDLRSTEIIQSISQLWKKNYDLRLCKGLITVIIIFFISFAISFLLAISFIYFLHTKGFLIGIDITLIVLYSCIFGFVFHIIRSINLVWKKLIKDVKILNQTLYEQGIFVDINEKYRIIAIFYFNAVLTERDIIENPTIKSFTRC